MSPPLPARRASTSSRKTLSSPGEIAPGVFVGGWKDAISFEGQRLCVLDEPPGTEVPDVVHVPIYDPEHERPLRENLDRLVGLVDSARSRGEPVLLFCGHGVRRGPLAGAWYLHRHDGISLDDAYARLAKVRPQAEPVQQWAVHWETLTETPAAHRRGKG